MPNSSIMSETQAQEIAETDPITISEVCSYVVQDELMDALGETPMEIADVSSQDSSEMTEDEQSSSKPNRELKQLLALSKEANLDTNISHKRKSMDAIKLSADQLKKTKPNAGGINSEFFPVTAECELEPSKASDEAKDEEISTSEAPKESDEKMGKPDLRTNKDVFCWRCHRDAVNISCETCPRSYHLKCLKQSSVPDVNNWPCPECVLILKAESTQTRTSALKELTLEHLCSLLKFAVKRMIECSGSEPFLNPVDEQKFPDYKKYIVQPMSLTLLGKNIKENLYGSPQAFEADAKWILHNSIIFNSYQSKLTSAAKTIMKICKQEMAEIEKCPTCYLNANTKKSTWFVEVCPKPHILVWAKLKGFPFWPAKVMCTNSSGMVDVRFFGAHDRAWIPSKECFLYSRKDPNSNKQKRNDIVECMKEVDVYISNIKAIYGEFNYAPFKHQYDPDNELQQLLLFIPRYLALSNKRLRTSSAKDKLVKKDGSEMSESMEGYGTDEETSEIESLNTKKRAMMLLGNSETPSKHNEYVEPNSDSDDEQLEFETDDDTQVLNNSTEIIRVKINRRSSLLKSKNSRQNLDESKDGTSLKLSRRNSDQSSVKSDSSRSSEKINRVEIPENVELSIGKTTSPNNEEAKMKPPVQVEIENSELTISPPSKTNRMSEKLIKKLTTDYDNAEKKASKSENVVKSKTDIILEKYKNLVREKIEASTSSSKHVVANVKKLNEIEVEEVANEENVISSTENAKPPVKKDEKKKLTIEKVTPKKKGEIRFRLILPRNDSMGSPYVKRREEAVPSTSKEDVPEPAWIKEEEKTPDTTRKTYKGASPATRRIKVIKTNNTETPTKENDSALSEKKPAQSEIADSNSSEDQELDETVLQRMINSSLKEEMERAKRRAKDTPEEKDTNSKKPKLDTPLSKENFKIVPIQTILNKKIEHTNQILTNEKGTTSKQAHSTTEPMDLVTVEIKSEPESEQENEETEYMEKKRKYLSALNISEKTDQETLPPKKHEIRTRSKTEEIGRGKNSDNISKIIDEVATSFSAKPEPKKTDRKSNQQQLQNSNSNNSDEKERPSTSDNGEIFVKSFAKMPTQQQSRQNQQQRVTQQKPRTFPVKSTTQTKINPDLIPTTTLTRITPVSTTITTTVSQSQTSTSIGKNIEQQQQAATLGTSGNVLILTQPGVILPTSQQLTYNAGSFVTFVPSQQNVAVMPTSQMINAVVAPGLSNDNSPSSQIPRANVEIHNCRSQNYIPQNCAMRRRKPGSNETSEQSSGGDIPALVPLRGDNSNSTTSAVNETGPDPSANIGGEDEFSLLHSLVPDSVSRAISEVLSRQLPKLKPRPPGPLSQSFDSGTPSEAGPISARINSISHKLGDYFRGMLIEMLEDLGKASSPEATIASLRQEIESLKQKHESELMDIRKNVCTILKDVQGSITEERERIIDDTRSACELEALRRIEEAKSKQWCANCGKEAQFYCCWNTSYCDYPCQQKHWANHMAKCTQNSGQSQQVQTPPVRPQPGQITFRPATPKTFAGRILTKPTKVYLNRAMSQKNGSNFKATQGHLALVDTSNLEFLTNSTLGNKIMASTSLLTRVKTVNSTTTSPSNGTQQQSTQPKVIKKNNSNNNAKNTRNSDSPNIISDEEGE